MRSETLVRLISLVVILVSVGGAGLLNPMIAASTGRHDLTYADTAEEGDPPQVALGIAMGAFRGLFVNILWIRANELKEAGKYHEAIELSSAITKLQPRFPQVWAFHSWNMAYNISVTTQTPEERWQWVNAGIELLRDQGIPANPNDMLLHKELAWIYIHKIGGYTDDANQYYKRKIAEEWTIVMGQPPVLRNSPDQEIRDRVINEYAARFDPIIDAPDTLQGLRARNPLAAELAAELEEIDGEPVGFGLLARYTFQTELDEKRAGTSARPMGPKAQAFAEILHDPQWSGAWDDLIAYTRKRVLVDKYKMEPIRMQRLVEAFGPIDWRLAPAHSLYWASRGVEVGRMKVDERNSESFDFVNTYRVMMQSIQELTRYGDLYFNFLDWAENGAARYQPMPNMYFIEAYADIMAQAHDQVGIFDDERRAVRAFSAGYENFLRQAIIYYYRRGPRYHPLAWKYFNTLIEFPGQNAGMSWRMDDMQSTLDEFVKRETYERWDSPYVAVNQLSAALQGAYTEGLLLSDQELFDGLFNFARTAHNFYVEKQIRDVTADSGDARMGYVDRDFGLFAGTVFAATMDSLSFTDAETLYTNCNNDDLRRYAYDYLKGRFERVFDEDNPAARGRTFQEVFIEPPGMEQFRIDLERKLAERRARENQGMEIK